ncbi:hypothetical protein NQ318_018636 [Aromia moschata]|uniref:Globin domain-containing protein n=1 Tax=Aromia moschata TaxID=1265417 RepID=A0AAV8ZHE4_9CUCU|nr:hypothetical protein NQ318_018636 [Aromia moschata]
MGILQSLYSYFGYGTPGRTDDPDPVTGLTSRDKYLIANSWAKVRKTPTESGVALLNVWLRKYPEHIQLFPFRDIPMSELPTNKKYQAHGNSIIYAVSSIIDALDEDDLLVTILTKVGETHVPRNATVKGFVDLKASILELFSSLFTEEEMKSWQKTLDVAFDVIIKSLKENGGK